MRILIPVTWIPYPPTNGARIRTWEIARRLARDHEIVFALHVRRTEDDDNIRELRRQGFEVIAGPVNKGLRSVALPLAELMRGGPPIAGLRRSQALESALTTELAKRPFDVIQVEHGVLARHPFLYPRQPNATLAITLHDLLSESYLRIAAIETSLAWRAWRRVNARGFHRMEREFLPRYDVCIAVSERDRRSMSEYVPSERLVVFPNCVDLVANTVLPAAVNATPELLFVGHMEYVPNADAARWLVREIFPEIQKLYPDARLKIVGGLPPRDLVAIPGVEIAGSVADLLPYYQRADVVLAPLRAGGGTRLKILEAMAKGRPVVSTTLGAEGLEATPGQHFLIAEAPPEFAAAVGRLLRGSALRQQITRDARDLVELKYGWDECARQHSILYESLARGRDRRDKGSFGL